jgi:hypothetical protein
MDKFGRCRGGLSDKLPRALSLSLRRFQVWLFRSAATVQSEHQNLEPSMTNPTLYDVRHCAR